MDPLVLQPKRLEAVDFVLVEYSQVEAGLGWLVETCGGFILAPTVFKYNCFSYVIQYKSKPAKNCIVLS